MVKPKQQTLDDEYRILKENLRRTTNGTPQIELPISDQGLRLTTTHNSKQEVPDIEDEAKVCLASLYRSPSFVASFLAYRETGGIKLSEGGELEPSEYPEEAMFSRALFMPDDTVRLYDEFFGILHTGIEELEKDIIRNRLALLNHLIPFPKNPLIGFSILTFDEWISDVRKKLSSKTGLIATETPDPPDPLKGKNEQEILDNPELRAIYGHHFLQIEHGGIMLAITLLAMTARIDVSEILYIKDFFID